MKLKGKKIKKTFNQKKIKRQIKKNKREREMREKKGSHFTSCTVHINI